MDGQEFYGEFSAWLDEVLKEELPEGIAAFNFNLYEGEDAFDIQLIGTSSMVISFSSGCLVKKKSPTIKRLNPASLLMFFLMS